MAKTKTIPWDIQDHLRKPAQRAAYLEAVLEDTASDDPDPGLVAAALGDIARAMGMAQVAQDAGLSRDRNPELVTMLEIMRALGIRLQAVPMEDTPTDRVASDEPDKSRSVR